MSDEIIEELWKVKDGIADEYAYDIDTLVDHLRAKDLSLGQKAVELRAMKTDAQNRKRKNQRHETA
jgi:hypothetical protein